MAFLSLLAVSAFVCSARAMQFTRLGSSELMVSKVCLGTMVPS